MKLISEVHSLTYENCSKYLRLMHLDTRRNRDLIESHKIKNNIYNVNADIFFKFDQGGKIGHSRKLFKRRSKLDVRKYVFSNRIVNKWNSLSCLAE